MSFVHVSRLERCPRSRRCLSTTRLLRRAAVSRGIQFQLTQSVGTEDSLAFTHRTQDAGSAHHLTFEGLASGDAAYSMTKGLATPALISSVVMLMMRSTHLSLSPW